MKNNLLAIGYTVGCIALASFPFAHAEETITSTELAEQLEQAEAINTTPTFDENLIPSITAKHTNPETMKEVLLSTISTTLSVRNANDNQLSADDYLISLRNIINKIDL